jgi:hypothetical protein
MAEELPDISRIARLEERVSLLREDVREMRDDLKALKEVTAQSFGGLRVLHWITLVIAATGGWLARAWSVPPPGSH